MIVGVCAGLLALLSSGVVLALLAARLPPELWVCSLGFGSLAGSATAAARVSYVSPVAHALLSMVTATLLLGTAAALIAAVGLDAFAAQSWPTSVSSLVTVCAVAAVVATRPSV
ncbi:MAG: hypothetical protein ACXVFO_14135 [Solirubrobacteraceae bacterium]